jgi:hypothetical protein
MGRFVLVLKEDVSRIHRRFLDCPEKPHHVRWRV